MEEAKFYWTMVAGIIAAGWVLIMFIRDRRSQSLVLTSGITGRLLDIDKIIIDNPDIPKFICKTAGEDEQFFRSIGVLDDDAFYRTKTYVYRQLNAFDEILSISLQSSKKMSFLKPLPLIESSDWETYMMITLRHPLYRSILNNEGEIFGESLRSFWNSNKEAIRSTPADRFMW